MLFIGNQILFFTELNFLILNYILLYKAKSIIA